MPECQTAVLFSTPFVGHDCSPFGEGFPTLEKMIVPHFCGFRHGFNNPFLCGFRHAALSRRYVVFSVEPDCSLGPHLRMGEWRKETDFFHLNIITFLSLQVGGYSRNDISFNIGNMLNLIWDDDPK